MSPALFLRAVRAPSLVAGAMPAIVLPALAAQRGYDVHLGYAALVVLGLVALQAGVNVVNDIFDDESGVDSDPEFVESPFPLGSRVLQSGALGRRGMWALAAACFGVGLACGVVLNTAHPGHVVLALGVAGFVLGYFYTAPPLRIAYHGAGEPVIFLLFGPLAGGGAYYVQTGTVDAAALGVASIVGVLVMAILYVHHFPQHVADARHGKRTPVVRLGPVGAGRLVPVILAAPFVGVAAMVAAGALPLWTLAFFLSAPFALSATRLALRRAGDARAMTKAFGQVLGLQVVGGLLLAGSLLLA